MVSLPKSGILSKVKSPALAGVSTGMIFGDAGVGKTHLLGTASEVFSPERVLIVTLNSFDVTLTKFPGIQSLDLLEDDTPLTAKMENLCLELSSPAKRRWDFIGFDDISRLNHTLRTQVVSEPRERRPTRTRTAVPEQQDYLMTENRIIDWFWRLRGAAIKRGFHLWVLAWENFDYITSNDYPNGQTYYYADLPPGLGRKISHEFDFCGRMTLTSVKRNMGTGGKIMMGTEVVPIVKFTGSDSATKSRVGFPDRLEAPTVRELLKPSVYTTGEKLEVETLEITE